jgi:DNA-binding transcriptional LysR family regulator
MDLLAQMATFVRVVEGGSLSAAARAQRLSLPAISRQLRALEAELGATLIVRSTRRLHVTDAGHRWYEHCVRVLRDIDEARASVRGSKTAQGSLTVSVSLTFGSFFIVPRLGKLAAKHPLLRIDLRLEDQLIDLVGEGVDIAIRAGAPPPDSTAFIARPILSMRRVLVASPRWLKKLGAPREPEHLGRHAGLVQVTPAGNVIPWSLVRAHTSKTATLGSARVVEPRGQLRTNAPLVLRELAIDGLGIAFIPDWLVADDLEAGRLRRVLPDWHSPSLTAWAIHRAELRGSTNVGAFLAIMPAG